MGVTCGAFLLFASGSCVGATARQRGNAAAAARATAEEEERRI